MFNLRSQIKRKIFNYFFLNEEKKSYVNELARLIDEDPKNVYRILINLEKEGLLKSEFQGKQRYFRIDKNYFLYQDYKKFFLKTIGIENILKDNLSNVFGIEEAYIFGSYVKGNYGVMSDIDILLIGKHRGLDAQKCVYKIEKDVHREINIINLKPDEFKKKKEKGDQFIKNIFNQKVIRLI